MVRSRAAGSRCVASAAAIRCTPAATTRFPLPRIESPRMSDTLIVNARLVNEGREFDADLRISRGRIDAIGTGLSARDGETVIDAAGRRLLPGMIDDQV